MRETRKQSDVALRVGQQMTLTIKSIGINGEGIGYFKRKIVFVDKALPGEVVHAEVTEVKEKFAYARLVKVVEPSRSRVTPSCPVYEECGGCSLQHMDYQAQLVSKQELVKEAFEKYTGRRILPCCLPSAWTLPGGIGTKPSFK